MTLEVFLNQGMAMIGAASVLSAYFLLQTGRQTIASYPYLVMNSVGGFLLLAASALTGQVGLVVLEGFWTLISVAALLRRMMGKQKMTPAGQA